ncbi:hypothetical protein TWF694_002409 [Orbilia ellipsospora]|uniref:F-box domain-containing protein n=1 Tax=Orbilia ellipsospora TaxID=2528407 RepID=A0AAV9X314_9PEZI
MIFMNQKSFCFIRKLIVLQSSWPHPDDGYLDDGDWDQFADFYVLLSHIAIAGGLTMLDWRATRAHDDYTDRILIRMLRRNPNLTSLNLDISGALFNLLQNHPRPLQLTKLTKLILHVRARVTQVYSFDTNIVCALLRASNHLIEFDLEHPGRFVGLAPDFSEHNEQMIYQALAQLSRLRSLGLRHADLAQLTPRLRIELLDTVSLKWCTNWTFLESYSSHPDSFLRLRDITIVANASDTLAIKRFLESLNPGLESILLAIDDIHSNIFSQVRELTSRRKSFYFLELDALLRHSATLRGFAFYLSHQPFRITKEEEETEEDLDYVRLILTCAYIQQFRQLLNKCSHLQELSIVVPMLYHWTFDSHVIETEDFRGFRLDGIKIIHIIPASLPMILRWCNPRETMDECDAILLTAEFLDSILNTGGPRIIEIESWDTRNADICEDGVQDNECGPGGYDQKLSYSSELGQEEEETDFEYREGDWWDKVKLVKRHRLGIDRKRRKNKNRDFCQVVSTSFINKAHRSTI